MRTSPSMSHRRCPVSPEGAAFITTPALGKSNLFAFHPFKIILRLLHFSFLYAVKYGEEKMDVCVINACRSNPLNMSAAGTVPNLPLPLALTVAFLNNLNVLLLSTAAAAACFK